MPRAAGNYFSRIGVEGAGDQMVPAEEVVPEVHYPSYVVYDTGTVGQLVKGINTEEFWLNPPFGRPRNIDYNSLVQFEESEWVQICTEAIIDGVINADYDFVPRDDGDDSQEDAIDEARAWFENLPSEETFEVILAEMLPDLLWYDAGVIVKMFPITRYSPNGDLMISERDYPVLDLTCKDGRSFMIEASPIGGRWRRFWQYSWMNAGSQPIKFSTEEVMYFRMRPNSRGIYGESRLSWIQNVVNYLIDATEQGSKIMENGLFMGGQIDHPDVKSIEELQKKALAYKSQLQGPKKAGKWLVTGGNVKVQSFPFNNQQMQWLDGQKWYAKLVMSAFKITPSELGFTEDLNRATGMQQSNIHKSRAIKPVLRALAREFNRCLVWKKWPGIKMVYPEALDFEDKMKQAQIDEIYLRSGKVAVNELRERDGQDKFGDEKFDEPFADQAGQEQDEWGDQSWNPFNDGSDTTDDEDEEGGSPFGKGGKGSGIKGHRTAKKELPPMHRRFDQVLHGAKDIDDVKARLNKFKASWSEEDYENVMREGACSTINTSVAGALKRAGFNAYVKAGTPKESGNPEHYITIVEDNKRKYVVDFVAEQFLGYGIYANIDEDKAFHTLTGYKDIYNSYKWNIEKGGKGSGIKGHRTAKKIEFSLNVPDGYTLHWMSPQEYIDRVSIVNRMSREDFARAEAKALEGGRPGILYHPPFSRESISRLKKAISSNAKIDMPSLEYGSDGLLSDQEGFHRAMIAKKIGIQHSNDEHYILNERKIPVAVKGDMPLTFRRPRKEPEDQIPYIDETINKMAATILDGQIKDLDEREEEAEDELKKFWQNKKAALMDQIEEELAEEIEKGGKGSGIKGHKTYHPEEFRQSLKGMSDAELNKLSEKIKESNDNVLIAFDDWYNDDDMARLDHHVSKIFGLGEEHSRKPESAFATPEQKKKIYEEALDKPTSDAIKKMYNITQEKLSRKYPNGRITLYRGVDGQTAEQFKKRGVKASESIMDEVAFETYNLSCWSTKPDVAEKFVNDQGKGLVLKSEFNISRVLTDWETGSSGIPEEEEFTVIGSSSNGNVLKYIGDE